MYEKILVPLDGSKLAEVVLPYAEELAARLGSEITLLSVSESRRSEQYHERITYIQKMEAPTKHGMQKYLEKHGEKTVKVDSKVLVGRHAHEIVKYADKEDTSLIVMATHGRSGIGRWTLGSVANKVVRATKRPIVLIRAKADHPDIRETSILNKVLVPMDGSKVSEAVIPYIKELSLKLETEVILLQVVASVYHFNHRLRTMATNYLEEVANGFQNIGISTRLEVREGSTAEGIIKCADELNTDMVAMSTHGLSGVGHWTFGSVAEKVLHAGITPLLLVRALGAFSYEMSFEEESSVNNGLKIEKEKQTVRKTYTPEQVINKLREADRLLSQGATVSEVSRKIGVTEQTYCHWREMYGDLV